MNLYLVRHADALPNGVQGITSDADRPLSDKGLEQVKSLAAAFRRLEIPLQKIVTSPLRRARQTAEELLRGLEPSGLELLECDELAPEGSVKKLARFLRDLDASEVALVGHQPDLSLHAAWLIGGKRAQVEFAKGGAACIACDQPPRRGAGTLLWLITPRWLQLAK